MLLFLRMLTSKKHTSQKKKSVFFSFYAPYYTKPSVHNQLFCWLTSFYLLWKFWWPNNPEYNMGSFSPCHCHICRSKVQLTYQFFCCSWRRNSGLSCWQLLCRTCWFLLWLCWFVFLIFSSRLKRNKEAKEKIIHDQLRLPLSLHATFIKRITYIVYSCPNYSATLLKVLVIRY